MTNEDNIFVLIKQIAIVLVSILVGIVGSIVLVLEFQKDDPIEVYSAKLSKEFLSKHIPVIDIRNEQDWKTTAVLKDSILMTFYHKDGRYDKSFFLKNLNSRINKNSKFAILSRIGEKSEKVAKILKSEGYENVINLEGGIREGIKNQVQFVKYHN